MSKLVPVRVRLDKSVAPEAHSGLNRLRSKNTSTGGGALSLKFTAARLDYQRCRPYWAMIRQSRLLSLCKDKVFTLSKEMRFYEQLYGDATSR